MLITTKNIILLFDESGTPDFTSDPNDRYFFGVSLTYDESYEVELFSGIDSLVKLSVKKSLKNNNISNEKAITICRELSKYNINIEACYIDLKNVKLISIIKNYYDLNETVRTDVRLRKDPEIRERKVPQIIHSQILSFCFMECIFKLLKSDNILYNVYPFIDDWSIPRKSIELYLSDRTESIQELVNEAIVNLNKVGFITINRIKLLKKNVDEITTKRKKFIDVVTSLVTRNHRTNSDVTGKDPTMYLLNNLHLKDSTNELSNIINKLYIKFKKVYEERKLQI